MSTALKDAIEHTAFTYVMKIVKNSPLHSIKSGGRIHRIKVGCSKSAGTAAERSKGKWTLAKNLRYTVVQWSV